MTMRNIENNLHELNDEQLREQIEALSEFMTPERYEVLQRTLSMRTRYLTLCAENTFHPQNASALVRHCEAFGVQQLHAVETLCRFSPNVQIVKGTDKWVDIQRHKTTAELVAKLRSQGYRIVATSPHLNDSTPESFDLEAGPFALFFGTEHAGISPELEACADAFIRVPMCGFVESLNVSACAAITLYGLTSRLRESAIEWQIRGRDHDEILWRWMMQSVKDSPNILRRLGLRE